MQTEGDTHGSRAGRSPARDPGAGYADPGQDIQRDEFMARASMSMIIVIVVMSALMLLISLALAVASLVLRLVRF